MLSHHHIVAYAHVFLQYDIIFINLWQLWCVHLPWFILHKPAMYASAFSAQISQLQLQQSSLLTAGVRAE